MIIKIDKTKKIINSHFINFYLIKIIFLKHNSFFKFEIEFEIVMIFFFNLNILKRIRIRIRIRNYLAFLASGSQSSAPLCLGKIVRFIFSHSNSFSIFTTSSTEATTGAHSSIFFATAQSPERTTN